jgi:hypothetical protein
MDREWQKLMGEINAFSNKAQEENGRLRAALDEAEKTIVALVRDRDFYRDELARKGGMN